MSQEGNSCYKKEIQKELFHYSKETTVTGRKMILLELNSCYRTDFSSIGRTERTIPLHKEISAHSNVGPRYRVCAH